MLAEIPAVFILLGLAAYLVLAGADFGAGFWTLVSGGRGGAAIREHARHAMGPVWEANHVWLIFVLVVSWTAYPVAFGSIASTLSVPLFVAAIGVILRGTAYALRALTVTSSEERVIERVFAVSSILTPFALGAVIGGIASGRVPVGNARGNLLTSWLNPSSVLAGTLTVATSAYLAAVYLAADAQRLREPALVGRFRVRALGVGLVAGALAAGGLAVVHWDAPRIWTGLTHGAGLVALVVSAAGGVGTLALAWRGRFGPARMSAAVATAAVVAGWALAQRPQLLPGLTLQDAAAGRGTVDAVIVGVAAGGVLLAPSLILLFGLFLRGTFDPTAEPTADTPRPGARLLPATPLVPLSLASLVAGAGLTAFAEPAWARAVGVAALLVSAVSGYLLLTTETEQ